MDWTQRLKSLVVDDNQRGRIKLKMKLMKRMLFDDNDAAVQASLLGVIEPAAAGYRPRKLIGHVEEGINARRDSYCSMWVHTALKLCGLVDEQGAILIHAPPARLRSVPRSAFIHLRVLIGAQLSAFGQPMTSAYLCS